VEREEKVSVGGKLFFGVLLGGDCSLFILDFSFVIVCVYSLRLCSAAIPAMTNEKSKMNNDK
jgi:hypothetical protein